MLTLHVKNIVLHLKGKLMGIAIGTPASVGQPFEPAILVTIKDLACLAGDPELPAEFRHRFAGWPANHKLQPFVHHRTLLPWHHFLSKKSEKV